MNNLPRITMRLLDGGWLVSCMTTDPTLCLTCRYEKEGAK